MLESFLSATSPAVDGIVAGAVVAALGYVGKETVQSVRQWRTEAKQRRARLHQLQALLQASRAAFAVQRDQAERLLQRLRSRYRDEEFPEGSGFERLFTLFYPRLDADEKDLHSIVRAYTEFGLFPLNEAMLAWLRDDVDHRTTGGKTGKELELATLLNQLDAHLLLWLAKYQAWIPNQPDHALVYLADEEDHGVGFPGGIDEAVATVLS